LTTIPPGSKAYRTTPSAICWPSRNRAAGRSSTEIIAALDAAAITTPLTANLGALAAAWGTGSLPIAGAGAITAEPLETEGAPDAMSGPATGEGEEGAGECGKKY
jgi:hypothetical protein